jgi:hypothetical protein
MGWLETADIIVAPIKPIYDPDKLNDFMDSLIPDMPRSARDEARQYDKKADFQLGKLYFDEVLGETIREISITTTTIEPEALKRAGVNVGKSHETKKESLKRRTWVRVYPDANSAQIIADYEQGIKNGTIEPNSTFDYIQHWFSPEQFENLKGSGEKPPIKHPKLLGDQ